MLKPGSRADMALSLLVAAAGVAAVGYGLWQIYPPLAWIFVGAVALFVSGLGQTPAPPAEAPKPS